MQEVIVLPIKIRKLYKNFDEKVIFENFSTDISDGITVIMAPSGKGKTTLLRILTGLDKDFKGEISGLGTVSYCPQKLALFPWYSAKKNITVAIGGKKAEALADEGLIAFGLSDSCDKKPHELSGGMCQRIAILRAWLFPSDTVILDEPFKGLDLETKEKVIEYLKRTKVDGRNVIFTTHSDDEASAFADSLLKL